MQDWIKSSLRFYDQPSRTAQDIESCMRRYSSLIILKDGFISGLNEIPSIGMRGTLPVIYKGVKYNIPIKVSLPKGYPSQFPVIFVEPTSSMIVRPSSWVCPSGLVQSPMQACWGYSLPANQMNIVSLLDQLCEIFGNEPPVYAKSSPLQGTYPPSLSPNTSPSPQLAPQILPSSYSSSQNSANLQSSFNSFHVNSSLMPRYSNVSGYFPSGPAPNTPSPSTIYQGPSMASGMVSSSPSHHSLSVQHTPSMNSLTDSGSNGPRAFSNMAPPPIPHSTKGSVIFQGVPASNFSSTQSNQQESFDDATLISLRSDVEDKIESNVEIVIKHLQKEVSEIINKKETFEDHSDEICQYLTHAMEEEKNLPLQIDKYIKETNTIQTLIDQVKDMNSLSPDDYLTTRLAAHKQMYELVAHIQGIEDTIYQLSRALYQEKLDLQLFIKHVRTMGREVFMKKATLKKIKNLNLLTKESNPNFNIVPIERK